MAVELFQFLVAFALFALELQFYRIAMFPLVFAAHTTRQVWVNLVLVT